MMELRWELQDLKLVLSQLRFEIIFCSLKTIDIFVEAVNCHFEIINCFLHVFYIIFELIVPFDNRFRRAGKLREQFRNLEAPGILEVGFNLVLELANS